MKEFIISPPFGQYIHRPNASSVAGTFTVKPRPGKLKQILKTLRPQESGFINNIGLRNNGIHSYKNTHDIVSVTALNPRDWAIIANVLPASTILEMNLKAGTILPTDTEWNLIMMKFSRVIVKLPAYLSNKPDYELVKLCYAKGVRTFHCFNSYRWLDVNYSGPANLESNIYNINLLYKEFSDLTVIAGGGIYDNQSLNAYKDRTPCKYFSLSTVWLKHPIWAWNLTK